MRVSGIKFFINLDSRLINLFAKRIKFSHINGLAEIIRLYTQHLNLCIFY